MAAKNCLVIWLQPESLMAMMRTVFMLAAGVAMMSPAYAAMSDAECRAAWIAADLNKDGVLDANEASRYGAALRVAGKEMASGSNLDETVFLENCNAGLFETATVEQGAPFEGANSFTEDQAQDRALAAGFANVSGLTKDDKGIWRGTAEANGQKVNIAVDYKGNVVSSQ